MSTFKDYVGTIIQEGNIVVTTQRGTAKGLKLAKVVGFSPKKVKLQEVGGRQKPKFNGFEGPGPNPKVKWVLVDDIRTIWQEDCVVVDGKLAFQYLLHKD